MLVKLIKECAWEIGVAAIACLLFVIFGYTRAFSSNWVSLTWIIAVIILLIMIFKHECLATGSSAALMLILFSLMSICCMYCAERYVIPRICLILMGGLFSAIILLAVCVIWRYKSSAITTGYALQLLLGIVTIIIGFAGVYMMLYYQYLPAGYDVIQNARNENSVLLTEDFCWYSVETFTSADISDVVIGDITYEEFESCVKERGDSDYSDWNKVQSMFFWVRLFTSIEALLFLFYISILVAGAGGEPKVCKNK